MTKGTTIFTTVAKCKLYLYTATVTQSMIYGNLADTVFHNSILYIYKEQKYLHVAGDKQLLESIQKSFWESVQWTLRVPLYTTGLPNSS